MAWFRFSVYKDVFFTGVEENENLKKKSLIAKLDPRQIFSINEQK